MQGLRAQVGAHEVAHLAVFADAFEDEALLPVVVGDAHRHAALAFDGLYAAHRREFVEGARRRVFDEADADVVLLREIVFHADHVIDRAALEVADDDDAARRRQRDDGKQRLAGATLQLAPNHARRLAEIAGEAEAL